MIALDRRPRLAGKARVRRDRHGGGLLLLYPERGLALNATAGAILELCDGERDVRAIAAALAARCETAQAVDVLAEVRAFLDRLATRGLIVEV